MARNKPVIATKHDNQEYFPSRGAAADWLIEHGFKSAWTTHLARIQQAIEDGTPYCGYKWENEVEEIIPIQSYAAPIGQEREEPTL